MLQSLLQSLLTTLLHRKLTLLNFVIFDRPEAEIAVLIFPAQARVLSVTNEVSEHSALLKLLRHLCHGVELSYEVQPEVLVLHEFIECTTEVTQVYDDKRQTSGPKFLRNLTVEANLLDHFSMI